ncbi:hypothetical protein [Geodermatophilus sp. SYSU D00710]
MSTPTPLGPLATHLAAAIAAARRQTIEIGELWQAAVAFDRSLASAPGARADLRAALTELHAAGVLALPRGKAHFDRRADPPLPTWVRRSSTSRPPAARPAARVWPTALQPVAALARRDEEFVVLDVVADFLRRGGATRISVPLRERSLELFGDEKRLDRLLGTRLFTSGALTLDLLRCHPVPMPFAAQWVSGTAEAGGQVTLLVAENHHTYASLLEATRVHAAAGGPGRHVGYGAGGQFSAAVTSVTLLRPLPTRILYFGDLDLRGVEIPARAAGTARAAGLPPVLPAAALYEALFAHGRPVETAPVADSAAATAAAWLGPLAAPAAALLAKGRRMAQEAIGLELLLEHPKWLDDPT